MFRLSTEYFPMLSTIPPSRGVNWTGLPVAVAATKGEKKIATCRLPNLVPRFLDFTLQWKTIVCVSRRVEEKRGAKGVNIYPPRNLIPRANVIGLKILFPAQRSRELGGNGWKCLRNGEPRIAKSETRCWEKSRRTGSGESRYRQISTRYVVCIGRWTEPISF